MPDNPFLDTVQMVQANRASLQLAKQNFPTQPGMVTEQAAITASLARQDGMSMQDIGRRSVQSSQMAQRHGLDASFGLRVGQSNAAFASAWGDTSQNLGFGGINQQRAGRLDQELRLAAARSPVANAMGAVHAMVEAGVLDKDVANLDYSRGPAGVMAQLKDRGIDMRVAGQFMNSTRANQEQIAKHGLQDQVREMQQGEIAGILGRDMENNLMGGFRREGLSRQDARQRARETSQGVTQELFRLAKEDPDVLNDPAKLMDALAGAAPGANREQLAGAMQAMRNRVMSDPNLRKFGNLQGLLAMNAGAVQQGNEMMGEAEGGAPNVQREHEQAEEQRMTQMTQLRKDLGLAEGLSGDALRKALDDKKKATEGNAGLNEEQKTQELQRIDQLRQLEEAGDVQRGPAAQVGRPPQGGDPLADVPAAGGGFRITGSLTLLDGGQGQLEGQAQGAAPGGE